MGVSEAGWSPLESLLHYSSWCTSWHYSSLCLLSMFPINGTAINLTFHRCGREKITALKTNCFMLFLARDVCTAVYANLFQSLLVTSPGPNVSKKTNFKCVPKVSRFHQNSSVIPPFQLLIATGFASRWPGCKWDINQNGTIYSYNHDGCKFQRL